MTKRTHNDDMLELLECTVCLEHMQPPIFQCANGHVLCKSCKTKVDKCPTCRCSSIDVRNLQLEKIAEKAEKPCRHGCSLMLPYLKEPEHAAQCSKRPLCCRYPNCKFYTDQSKELAQHLQTEHQLRVEALPIWKELIAKEEGVDNKSTWTGVLHDNEKRYFQYKFAPVPTNGGRDYHAAYVLALDHSKVSTDYKITIQGRRRQYTFYGPVIEYDAKDTPPENLDCLVIPLHMIKWMGLKDTNDTTSFSIWLNIELIKK